VTSIYTCEAELSAWSCEVFAQHEWGSTMLFIFRL